MILFQIIGLVAVSIVYFFVRQFYFKKRLNIKDKQYFVEGRNNFFLTLEYSLIAFIIFVGIILINLELTVYITPVIGPLLFFLIFTVQGIEEWLLRREEKVYYYRFLASIAFISLMIIFSVGEGLI